MDALDELAYNHGKRLLELEQKIDKIENRLEELTQNTAVVLLAITEVMENTFNKGE